MLSNPLKRKNFSIILPMSERVKCSTTRVSFTSNRIWASVFEIGYLYVLTSLTIVLATYLLVCCYRWNHQNNTSFVKCSALWWNDTRQHHTGEFCCEGKWKKTPIPWLCITLWELARWTLAFLLSLGWRWWWWWQQWHSNDALKRAKQTRPCLLTQPP